MDEPDYDDLIEDYMEEFDEPPPSNTMATATQEEYDEDFLEEMEAAAGDPAAAASNNNSADIEEQSPASPISNNLNGRLFAAASPSATATTTASAAQIRSQLASSRSHQGDTQPDIFSFERYVCSSFTALINLSCSRLGVTFYIICSLTFPLLFFVINSLCIRFSIHPIHCTATSAQPPGARIPTTTHPLR